MTVYLWILFIIGCIISILPIIIYIGQASDDGISEVGNASYLFCLSLFFSGLIPVLGNYIIQSTKIFLAWYIYILVILVIQFILLLGFVRRDPHYLFSFILSCAMCIIPIILYGRIDSRLATPKIINPFNVDFPEIVLSFWLPLLIICIAISLIIKGSKIHIYNNLQDLENTQQQRTSRHDMPSSVEGTLVRMTIENVSQQMSQSLGKTNQRIDELSEAIRQLYVIKSSSNDRDYFGHVSQSILLEIKNEIKRLTLDIRDKSQYSNATEQILIKELTHFIATPLATIEATCDLLKGKDNNKKNEEYLARIKNAVNICRGILSTYREIFLGTQNDDTPDLKESIRNAFDMYIQREKKNIKLNLQIQNRDYSYSNYFILSSILPILSNAVNAAKVNSIIEIIESHGYIRISNSYNGEIDLDNLKKDFFSTKADHKGMGLYTVRHLLASRKAGELKIYLKDNRIYFEIPVNK